MDFFERLGTHISRSWHRCNYDSAVFPEIANLALQEMPPISEVTLWDITKWTMLGNTLPAQYDLDADFGQPPLTVYNGPGFSIDILFWVTGVPRIHQHSFSGAFYVLDGSSIHSTWNFVADRTLLNRVLLGRLRLQDAELLTPGETRPIIAGSRHIHATFHLERPTLTVVVRTRNESGALPQYAYMFPSIAYASQEAPPHVIRRRQILSMLLASGRHREFSEVMRHAAATADAEALMYYLVSTYPHIPDQIERQDIMVMCALKHKELLDALGPALEYDRRRIEIVKLRQGIVEPDLQFCLALLLNIPDRIMILRLICDRYPLADPSDKMTAWIERISYCGLLGGPFGKEWLFVLKHLFEDRSKQTIISMFREQFGTHESQDSDFISELIEAFQSHWLFKPIFGIYSPDHFVSDPDAR